MQPFWGQLARWFCATRGDAAAQRPSQQTLPLACAAPVLPSSQRCGPSTGLSSECAKARVRLLCRSKRLPTETWADTLRYSYKVETDTAMNKSELLAHAAT